MASKSWASLLRASRYGIRPLYKVMNENFTRADKSLLATTPQLLDASRRRDAETAISTGGCAAVISPFHFLVDSFRAAGLRPSLPRAIFVTYYFILKRFRARQYDRHT